MNQKSEFTDRLKRIERNPGNGRMVEPGAVDAMAQDTKRRKNRKQPQIATKQERKVPSKPGRVWLVGALAGFAMFTVWVNIYPGMETPQTWSASALPVDPTLGGMWVAIILVFGLTLLRQLTIRMGVIMSIGMLMGGMALGAVAFFVPDTGVQLTSETFVSSVQSMVASLDVE